MLKKEGRASWICEFGNILIIAVGLGLVTVAYNMYLIPNNIAPGGFTGVGQFLNAIFGLPVGGVALVMNIPLFAMSFKSMGIRFGVMSIVASALLSVAIDNVELPVATYDSMLAAVYGGVINGIGFGLILRGRATTGGTDMLAALVNRYFSYMKISVVIFLVDGIIVAASMFVFDAQAAMYALIAALIMNVVIEIVIEGPNTARAYIIISDKSEEISREIMQKLNRGVTGLHGKGMYSGVDKRVLICVVNRMEAVSLRRIVLGIDPKAFVIVNKVHEALGEGFKSND